MLLIIRINFLGLGEVVLLKKIILSDQTYKSDVFARDLSILFRERKCVGRYLWITIFRDMENHEADEAQNSDILP
jgi:hypothetical protein